jgi:hypothetical protein
MAKILRANETGHGILIEYDSGYISPKDNQKFISEMKKLDSGQRIIEEPLLLYAVLQKCGVENRNGRVYPREILERESRNYQKLIEEKRALGEADHPESSIISVDRISHNITDIWWEGNTLLGKLEVLMSPGFVNQGIISCKGDQVANLIRKGIMIGVSSRGVGSLDKKDGKNYVQEDFELICWDVVTSPSTPGSWIFNRKEESAPFVESTQTKKSLIIDTLDNFLND